MALVLDHLGAFCAAQHDINKYRLVGVALVVAGAVLIRTH